ncbi:MAG: AAA family ATPase [Planctomycetes bacterium]|nr:AAA family ATPase [Planctomycetota bacterium]
MAEQPRDSQGRGPDGSGTMMLAARPASAGPGAAELLASDVFEPALSNSHSGHTSTVSVHGLLRHKWLMLAVFVLVAGPSIPCVWLFTIPTYESTAVVRVEPVVPKIVYPTENNGMLPLYREYMNTQVNAIRNPKVLERVLDREDIRETHWYREEGHRLLREPLPPLERLAKALQVQTRPNTQLIGITVGTERGGEAKLIVDAVVDEYYRAVKERERLESIELIGKVREQHAALETEIKGLRELRRTLSRDSGLMDSVELRTQLSTNLNDLESRYMEADRSFKLLKNRLERQTGGTSQPADLDDSPPAEADPAYAEDAEWRNLNLAMKNARHELDLARQEFGESHPRIRQLASNVSHADSLLADREAQLKERWKHRAETQSNPASLPAASMAPEVVQQQLLPDKELERDLLQKDIDKLREKVVDIQNIARNEEQVREKEQVFATVRDRLTSLEMESKAPGRIAVDSYGLKPSEPDRDRRPLLSVMALAGALMAALAVGYLRHMSDSRIHEVDDIQHIHRVPFLGRLPLLAKAIIPRELGGASDHSLLASPAGEAVTNGYPAPNSLTSVMEGVRMVRTALLERLGSTTGERAILITSPTSQAGKSSLALLLARSLAATGKKVLLVEGDFYRPSFSSRLGLNEGPGLAALLSRAVDDVRAIQRTAMPFLDVLPMGNMQETFNPEVLANGIFADCMVRWKRSYDFVILDSPPVLPVADARILAGHVDGTLLVLKASHNRRAEAWTAFGHLAATRSGVLGVVMIGGDTPSASYHYGYGEYAYATKGAGLARGPGPGEEGGQET